MEWQATEDAVQSMRQLCLNTHTSGFCGTGKIGEINTKLQNAHDTTTYESEDSQHVLLQFSAKKKDQMRFGTGTLRNAL